MKKENLKIGDIVVLPKLESEKYLLVGYSGVNFCSEVKDILHTLELIVRGEFPIYSIDRINTLLHYVCCNIYDTYYKDILDKSILVTNLEKDYFKNFYYISDKNDYILVEHKDFLIQKQLLLMSEKELINFNNINKDLDIVNEKECKKRFKNILNDYISLIEKNRENIIKTYNDKLLRSVQECPDDMNDNCILFKHTTLKWYFGKRVVDDTGTIYFYYEDSDTVLLELMSRIDKLKCFYNKRSKRKLKVTENDILGFLNPFRIF